jgi:hypothetical protein
VGIICKHSSVISLTETCIYIDYTLRFYFPYLSLLAQPVNITLYGPGLDCLVFDSVPERYLYYYFDKKYNIANSSCHFGSYGSIWTGPSPKKYYMDLRSFGPYNIFMVRVRSIYCHITLSAMNYLLYMYKSHYFPEKVFHHQSIDFRRTKLL